MNNEGNTNQENTGNNVITSDVKVFDTADKTGTTTAGQETLTTSTTVSSMVPNVQNENTNSSNDDKKDDEEPGAIRIDPSIFKNIEDSFSNNNGNKQEEENEDNVPDMSESTEQSGDFIFGK